MDPFSISRRALLAGSAAFLWAARCPARAEPVSATLVVIAASASVVSSVLAFQQKGGSLALQFEALNYKLDAILANQKLLLDAISEVNESVNTVLRVVDITPARTVALEHLREAQRAYDTLIDSLAALEKDPVNKTAKGDIAALFRLAYDTAINLKNDTTDFIVPLEVAFGCERLKAVVYALARQRHVVDKDNKALLLNTCIYLEEALTGLALEKGIRAHIPPVKVSMDKVVKLIDKHPLRRALPEKFADVPEHQVMNFEDTTEVCRKVKTRSKEVASTPIYGHVGDPDQPMGAREIVGYYKTFDEITDLSFPRFSMRATRAIGGRYCYQLELLKASEFGSGHWKRRVSRSTLGGDTTLVSSDPKAKIAVCQKFKVDKEGVPGAPMDAFLDLLSRYDAHVAVESRLLALHGSAVASRSEMSSFKETLRT